MKKYKIPGIRLNKVNVIAHVNYPNVLLIPMCQGTPQESITTVSSGKKVARGDLLARKHNQSSQNHHSAVGGEVVKHKQIQMPKELSHVPVVEIKFGGHFSTFAHKKRSHVDTLSEKEILALIENAGIYDLDVGSVEDYLVTQMSHNKVMHIVVNAIEFSPYLILEEKILQMHSTEIAIAAKIVSQLYNNKIGIPKFIINSNVVKNRRSFSKELHKISDAHVIHHALPYYKTDHDINFKVIKNIDIAIRSLSRILSKPFDKNSSIIDIEFTHTAVILRPSTLLAIYEAVIYEKPYIDLYIQTVIELKNIMIQRVPLGMPLLYSLSPYNEKWNSTPHHRLFGNFIEQHTFSSFIHPVVKDKLHYWCLFDEDFSLLRKRLHRWMQ